MTDREFTAQDQVEFLKVVAQHKGIFCQPTVDLELVDGKLIETGGTWRQVAKLMKGEGDD